MNKISYVFTIAFMVFSSQITLASISDPSGNGWGVNSSSLKDAGLQKTNPVNGSVAPIKPVMSRKIAAIDPETETVATEMSNEAHADKETESADTQFKSNPHPKPLDMGYLDQEVAIIVSENGYFPKKIFLRKNIRVKLYIASTSENTLCISSDELGINKGIKNRSELVEISFVPVKEGIFKFSCPISAYLKGEIIVRE